MIMQTWRMRERMKTVSVALMMMMMLSTMLKLQLCLTLVGLCQGLADADPDSQFEYGLFGTPSQVHRAIQRECKVEMVTIVRTNCKVEFDEECTYEKECEEKE